MGSLPENNKTSSQEKCECRILSRECTVLECVDVVPLVGIQRNNYV